MSRELHDERISAYLDGELSASERAEVDELLKTSSSHQQFLAELTMLRESMQSLPRESLGKDFADRVTKSALRAAQDARTGNSAPGVRPKPSSPGRHWLFASAGGIAALAACVALVVYSLSGGPTDHLANLNAKGTGDGKAPLVESAASEFVRAVTSSKENEAVVVRVKLTKDAIRGKLLDEALQAQGIGLATADVTNEAARSAGLAYKELVESQASSSAAPRGAADVVFLEVDAAKLERALASLEKNAAAKAAFAPESLVASTGKGADFLTTPEGESEPGGKILSSTPAKLPEAGYFQHLPPRGFTLAPAAVPTAVKAGEKVPAKKSARVLIVVEVAE